MKLNVTGMIYDRMVQNARNNASDDWEGRECDRPGARERRLRQRRKEEMVLAQLNAKDLLTFNPSYRATTSSVGATLTRVEAQEEPEPERLFGDPPPKRGWGWLKELVVNIVVIALIFALAVLMLFSAAAIGAQGTSDENRPANVPIEVEK